ncbi:MAG: ribonuclease PH [Oligoflexia bacterium]|nr:ribonuclease PH [Oligoflexia bacterium]
MKQSRPIKRSPSSSRRVDGRQFAELRPVNFETKFVRYPEGSVLVSMGYTRVLCNVTIQDGVPNWMRDQQKPGGWVTAEYSMLPRSTHTRTSRETRGPSGRTQEIQRLIGRSLRSAVHLEQLGARTITVDCDVLQADGGTRTASITGGYVALRIALDKLIREKQVHRSVLGPQVAAVSAGLVKGKGCLDLCYLEDSKAETDMNVVMNSNGEFIEIQGTAEGKPFSEALFNHMLKLARGGIKELLRQQLKAIEAAE